MAAVWRADGPLRVGNRRPHPSVGDQEQPLATLTEIARSGRSGFNGGRRPY